MLQESASSQNTEQSTMNTSSELDKNVWPVRLPPPNPECCGLPHLKRKCHMRSCANTGTSADGAGLVLRTVDSTHSLMCAPHLDRSLIDAVMLDAPQDGWESVQIVRRLVRQQLVVLRAVGLAAAPIVHLMPEAFTRIWVTATRPELQAFADFFGLEYYPDGEWTPAVDDSGPCCHGHNHRSKHVTYHVCQTATCLPKLRNV